MWCLSDSRRPLTTANTLNPCETVVAGEIECKCFLAIAIEGPHTLNGGAGTGRSRCFYRSPRPALSSSSQRQHHSRELRMWSYRVRMTGQIHADFEQLPLESPRKENNSIFFKGTSKFLDTRVEIASII